MLEWLSIDLIVEIGILAGPDEYEQIAKTSKRNAIILQKPYIIKATNALIVKVRYPYFNALMYQGKFHSFNDMPCKLWNEDEAKEWYRHGMRHRDNDQPAIIYLYAKKEWYQNGELHRDNDQPAGIYLDVKKEWYQHGKLHRDNDQPASIYSDGKKEWYQHGKLHRDNDQPAVIYSNGTKIWYQHGKMYRDNDQPALIYPDILTWRIT
jgi:hypothetical protein